MWFRYAYFRQRNIYLLHTFHYTGQFGVVHHAILMTKDGLIQDVAVKSPKCNDNEINSSLTTVNRITTCKEI